MNYKTLKVCISTGWALFGVSLKAYGIYLLVTQGVTEVALLLILTGLVQTKLSLDRVLEGGMSYE